MAYDHPLELEASLTELPSVSFTAAGDEAWHFSLALPPHEVLHQSVDAPPPGGMASLAMLRLQGGGTVEVLGFDLQVEVHGDDLLRALLQQRGARLLSLASLPDPAGNFGDALVRFDDPPSVARYYVPKWGRRVFVLIQSVEEPSYAALAGKLLAVQSSFRALGEAPGPYAEELVVVTGREPLGWSLALPQSWAVARRTNQRELRAARQPNEGALDVHFAASDAYDSPKQAVEPLLKRLAKAGLEGEEVRLEPEEAQPPFKKIWSAVTELRPLGELRIRLFMNARAWCVASVVGPTREQAPLAWMRNKRSLDVLAENLEM